MSLTVQSITNRDQWHDILSAFSDAHFLQTWEWGNFKRDTTGWHADRLAFNNTDGKTIAIASVLSRKIGPLRVVYVPKGPILSDKNEDLFKSVVSQLKQYARKHRAIWLKIDPDIVSAYGLPETSPIEDDDRPHQPQPYGQNILDWLKNDGWSFSSDQVQFRNTFYTDLTKSEDDLMSDMNQSTRRKIRKADKKGVTVREAESEADLKKLFDIYNITSDRQDFTIRPWEYYRDLWSLFWKNDMAHILMAEAEDTVVGGVILFHLGERVWYFNGMSSNQYRNHQPNHTLQWEAMKWAKSQGYKIYDWWGAPNEFNEDDPMWGVYRFKDGFGGKVVRHIGAWDYVPFPPLYFAYEKLMPMVLNILRRQSPTE